MRGRVLGFSAQGYEPRTVDPMQMRKYESEILGSPTATGFVHSILRGKVQVKQVKPSPAEERRWLPLQHSLSPQHFITYKYHSPICLNTSYTQDTRIRTQRSSVPRMPHFQVMKLSGKIGWSQVHQHDRAGSPQLKH